MTFGTEHTLPVEQDDTKKIAGEDRIFLDSATRQLSTTINARFLTYLNTLGLHNTVKPDIIGSILTESLEYLMPYLLFETRKEERGHKKPSEISSMVEKYITPEFFERMKHKALVTMVIDRAKERALLSRKTTE